MRSLLALVLGFSAVACGGQVSTGTESDSGPLALCSEAVGPLKIAVTQRGVIAYANTEFDAMVVSVEANRLVLDTCSPAADCMPSEAHVDVGGARVDLRTIPKGAYVHVTYETQPTGWGGPSTRVVVQSKFEWAGDKNPAATGDAVLVAASDGFDGAPSAAFPFTLGRTKLSCPATGDSCRYYARYAYEFSTGAHRIAKTLVPMGQTEAIDVAGTGGGAYMLNVTNLRSYESKCTDDYWNWSWFAVYTPKGV